MFSLGSLWLIFLLQTGAALEYPELYTHSARMGSNTTIPCKFNVDAIPPARRSFTMFWHFQEQEIFRSPNAPKAADPRLSIDQDRIQDGIADLSMSRVSISDGGLYICSMVQTPERKVKEIRLDIYAPPQITITNKTALINKESVLCCAISGFYPVDIDIKWLRDGEILDHVIMEIPQRGPHGTYSVNSSVTITPTEEDRKRIFSYRIQHESLTAPLQEDFRLVFEDEERTKQNIIIITSVSVAVGVILIGIITAIMWSRKRRRRGKGAETDKDQNSRLVSSGDVRQPPDSIINTNEEFTRNQQRGPPEEESCSQMTGTNPAATPKSSGDDRQRRDSKNDTKKTSIMNPQPEPWGEPNHSQMTNTRSLVRPKPSDTTVYTPGGRHTDEEAENQHTENTKLISGDRSGGRRSDEEAENQDNENKKLISGDESGDVRQPRDSINDTNKTSIMIPQPEPREGRNHSQKTSTRSAVPPKPQDPTAYRPGDVRQPRDSINDTNKRFTSNPKPKPREGWNHSQMTATRSAVHRKPSDTTVSTPGNVRGTRDSINNTNKTPIMNPQPEPREEPNHSKKTGTKSVVPPKPPNRTISTPGDPSLENQRPERHETILEDQKTKPSANIHEAKVDCAAVNVKNLKAKFQK